MSDYLCEDLIVEIFKLPPKSLLRFRSLSKSLCKCISSPGFIHMHTFRSPQKVLLIHRNDDDKNKREYFYTLHGEDALPFCCPKREYLGITTMPFPCRTNFRILGSCNGILHVWTAKSLILWNPSIRRKLIVPECPWTRRFGPFCQTFGFGFDPIDEDYKIVWISNAKDISSIYSVKTGTWCDIASPKPKVTYVSHKVCFFNGVLHWVVSHPAEAESQDPFLTCYILTFNLSTHVFGMIPMPAPTTNWMTTVLTTIQGSLALISYGLRIHLDTWIWVRRDSSWSVGFKLNTNQRLVQNVLQLQPQPTNNGDLLLSICDEVLGLYIQVYNPKTGVRSRVVEFNATSTLVNFCRCVETLHLVDMGETAYETNQL